MMCAVTVLQQQRRAIAEPEKFQRRCRFAAASIMEAQGVCHFSRTGWRRRAVEAFLGIGQGMRQRVLRAHRHPSDAPSGGGRRTGPARRHRWGPASADRPAAWRRPAPARRDRSWAKASSFGFGGIAGQRQGFQQDKTHWGPAAALSTVPPARLRHRGNPARSTSLRSGARIFPTCGPSGTPACHHVAAGERKARLLPAIGDRQQHAPGHARWRRARRPPSSAAPGP